MPVTQPMSLKDFFKHMGQTFTMPPIPAGPAVGPGFSSRTQNLPNGGGSYKSPVPSQGGAPYGSPEYVSPDVPIYSRFGENPEGTADLAFPGATPPPTTPPPSGGGNLPPSGNRVFSGGGSAPAPAGGAPAPAPAPNTPPQPLDYSKYINPKTGQPYSPKEYADLIAMRAGNGTVPTYAGNAIDNANMSPEELTRRARLMNNERNDIAVGEKDPYKVASKSGIQYSAAELGAIEKAYAGIYDPAINDVFAKLEARQKADAEEAQAKRDLEKSERDLAGDLLKIDKNFENDLKLEDVRFRNDAALKAIGNAMGAGNYDLSSKQQSTLLNITNKYSNDGTINKGLGAIQIKNLTKAIAANPKSAGNQLIALYTLVKNLDPDSAVREGELDLAQRTNSYLGKFGDSLARIQEGRVLNPEAIKELTTATDLLADEWVKTSQRRQKQYKSQASIFGLSEPFDDYVMGYENPDTIAGEGAGGGPVPAGTDGAAYGFPGYHSDGTQWVEN